MNKFVRKNKKGFTLTEMIVVIAIIGILAAVMIPSVVIYVNKARQNAAYQQAVAVLDFYDAYNTELSGGLLKEVSDVACIGNEHTFDNDSITCSTCGKDVASRPGDSIYTGFFDYYEEMTGKAVPTGTEFNDAKTQFTYVAENGVKVIITLSDMSVTYSK